MLTLNKQKNKKSGFVRNVLTLMTGTSIAQAIPIAISPILTRIYTPDDFGLFAIYMSIVSILAVIATGRYELAIMLPEKDKEAINIVLLSIIIALCISIALFLIIWLLNEHITQFLGNPEISKWLYFVPISILLTGVYQAINYWFNRKKEYTFMAKNRVIQTSTNGLFNLTLGFIKKGTSGLVLGYILSQLIVTIRFLVCLSRESNIKDTFSKEDCIKQLKRYINFPKYLVPAHLLNTSSMNFPIILLTTFYGSILVGYFSLVQRVLRAPTSIVSSALGDVFRQKAVEDLRLHKNCRSIYNKTLLILISIASIPYLIIYTIAPDLFGFVFGEEWEIAGEYARILIPMIYLQFISSPLSNMFIIKEKQSLDLIWQIGLFILTTSSILIGHFYFGDFKMTLGLFSFSYSFMYLINLLLTFTFSKG